MEPFASAPSAGTTVCLTAHSGSAAQPSVLSGLRLAAAVPYGWSLTADPPLRAYGCDTAVTAARTCEVLLASLELTGVTFRAAMATMSGGWETSCLKRYRLIRARTASSARCAPTSAAGQVPVPIGHGSS